MVVTSLFVFIFITSMISTFSYKDIKVTETVEVLYHKYRMKETLRKLFRFRLLEWESLASICKIGKLLSVFKQSSTILHS